MSSKSIYEWAQAYCGDPESHISRGKLILEFLKEEGLQSDHRVLDAGSGALSQGEPLINYLDTGKYVGLEPNGWLVEAALKRHPKLAAKEPRFSHATDFNVEGFGGFDYIIAHSVFSHVAHWQLAQAFSELRKSVSERVVFLASIRLDQYNSYHEEWQYPGNSHFRFQTVQAVGYEQGWMVERRDDYQKRMIELCPNDVHHWIKAIAQPTPTQINEQHFDDEIREKTMREIRHLAKVEYERRESEKDWQLEVKMAQGQREDG